MAATDDPVAYVVSENLHRRQLSLSERAQVGVALKKIVAERLKENQRLSSGPGKKGKEILPDLSKGQARDEAGKLLGVSGRLIQQAEYVEKHGTPGQVKAVAIGKAIEEAYKPKAEKKKATAPDGKRSGRPKSDGANCPKTSATSNRDESARTTAVAAKAVGMGRRSYEKAKAVVDLEVNPFTSIPCHLTHPTTRRPSRLVHLAVGRLQGQGPEHVVIFWKMPPVGRY